MHLSVRPYTYIYGHLRKPLNKEMVNCPERRSPEPYIYIFISTPGVSVGDLAFLIPGDEELFVGGGALNGAVGKLLFEHANQPMIQFEKDASGKFVTVKEGDKEVPKFGKETCPYKKTMSAIFAVIVAFV